MFYKHMILTCALIVSSTSFAQQLISCPKVSNSGTEQCAFGGEQIYLLNKMPYALCSKSLCTINKKTNSADCVCSVEPGHGWKSLSLSPTNYQSSKPTYDKDGNLTTVQSNFSFANQEIKDLKSGKLYSYCSHKNKTPWTNCFGVRCNVVTKTVNGKKITQAHCSCPIERSKKYVVIFDSTKNCNVNSSKVVWSAIDSSNAIPIQLSMMRELYSQLYPNSMAGKVKGTID